MSGLGARLWPASRLPGLRRDVARAYIAADWFQRNLRFAAWRLASRTRFGAARWVRLDGGPRIRVLTTDYRGYLLWRTRGTQREKVAIWRELASRRPACAVDVGANYGEFTLALAESGIPVLAIEANPELHRCLAASCAPYASLHPRHLAASDREGTASFYIDPTMSGSASLGADVPRAAAKGRGGSGAIRQVEVRAVRLDEAVPAWLGTTPDSMLLKLDVEGYELPVLEGVQPLLARLAWWRGIVEFNPTAVRRGGGDPDALWALLRRLNARVIDLRDSVPGSVRRWLAADVPAPAAAPAGEVDVLVGGGALPPHGG